MTHQKGIVLHQCAMMPHEELMPEILGHTGRDLDTFRVLEGPYLLSCL